MNDILFAWRQLRKHLGFALTAVVVFALGIAASTTIFAFVDAALVKPLPYRDASRLVGLYEKIPVGDRYHVSYGDYLDWKRQNRVFESLDAYEPWLFELRGEKGTEQAAGSKVSDGFFRTLGVKPMLGRDFRPGEDDASAVQTVLLSYGAWQRRFGADPNVVGRTVTMDGLPYLVIGVLPQQFHFAPVEPVEFWATLHGDCGLTPTLARECHKYYGIARLKDGVTVADAQAELAGIARQIAVAYPKSNGDRGVTVLPLREVVVGRIRPILFTLLGGAALLLLIALVNIASLLLVRTEGRRREIAVRGALGASRGRLGGQFIAEGFLLAVAGCVVGMATGMGAVKLFARQIRRGLLGTMPYLQNLHFTMHLALFGVALALLGGVVFSVAPAMRMLRADMQEGLRDGGRSATGGGWRHMGAGLVIVELAVGMVLLASAGVLGKSFYRLLHVDLGLSAEHLAVLHVARPGDSTDAQALALERAVVARMQSLPGVTSVGVSDRLAVGDGDGWAHFRVFGWMYVGEGDEAIERYVSIGYFETLRTRLLRGRYFTEHDDGPVIRVAVVNQTMARRSFGGEDPLGKRIIDQYDKDHSYEVVGVVEDIKEGAIDDAEPQAAVYFPFDQSPTGGFFVTLRAAGSPATMLPAMVRAVRMLDKGLIVDREETMSGRINDSQAAYLHRSAAWIVGVYAGFAMLLAMVGLYGVTSYSVAQRTREIGVRMALGADRGAVYRLILNEGGRLALVGISVGVVCSLVVTQIIRALLFGVSPWDVGALFSVVCLMIAAALLASYVPARRAASIDPMEALRAD